VDTQEAVRVLSERARRTARGWYVFGAIATVAGGFVMSGAILVAQLSLWGHGELKSSLIPGFLAAALTVPAMTRVMLRGRLALSRKRWIEQLASEHRLDSSELEQHFTLDSW
jgi:hypothetical protein